MYLGVCVRQPIIGAMQVAFACRTTITNHHHLICYSKNIGSWAQAIRISSSPQAALLLYAKMQHQNVTFTSHAILFTLKACSPLCNLPLIRHLHAHLFKLGFNTHLYVGTSLLHAYAIVHFHDARQLFEELPERNTITWNTMVTGYSKTGDVEGARLVFNNMPRMPQLLRNDSDSSLQETTAPALKSLSKRS